MPIIDRRATDIAARTLEQLVPVIDQLAAAIAGAIIDQRDTTTDASAVTEVAAQVAEDITRALVHVDADTPTLDTDRIRLEIVEAARAGSVSEVIRDSNGNIRRVETKYDGTLT